jgi:hypothetical protein
MFPMPYGLMMTFHFKSMKLMASTTAQNEVLASFFQSLLTKKVATSNGSNPGSPSSTRKSNLLRKTVEEELEKIENLNLNKEPAC